LAHPAGSPTTEKRPPVIGIDGGSWANRRGYGRFLREILPPLVQARPLWRFVVFLDRDDPYKPAFANVRWVDAGTRESVAEAAAADGARTPADLLRMSRAVAQHKLDLFFFPTVYSYFPILRNIPIAVGIHDTMADRHPEWAFAGKKQELLWRAKVRMALAQAKRIITVSRYSQRSIAEVFRIDPSSIAVVGEAASPVFRPLQLPREDFLLAVGGISPNKNLSVLLQALPELRTQFPELRLVLVGDHSGDSFRNCYQELLALRAELGLQQSPLVRYALSRRRLRPSACRSTGMWLSVCGCGGTCPRRSWR
jgi:glycosyltransferase involved in cell wall biosynthesis